MSQVIFRQTRYGCVTASASAIYDSEVQGELFRQLHSLPPGYLASATLLSDFLKTYRAWLGVGELNSLTGLNSFKPYITQAITNSIDNFIMLHSDKRFRVFRGEYPYYTNVLNRLPVSWAHIDESPLNKGDAVMLSAPFSASGELHPQMNEIFSQATNLQVPVFLDCAFWGICQNIQLDLSAPCIESVAFSLSKCFGLAPYRVGVLFSKNPPPAIVVANEWSYVNYLGVHLGLKLMQNFSPDFIAHKYRVRQETLCRELRLTASSTLIFGLGDESWSEFKREGTYNRVCLSPIFNEEVQRGQSRPQPTLS